MVMKEFLKNTGKSTYPIHAGQNPKNLKLFLRYKVAITPRLYLISWGFSLLKNNETPRNPLNETIEKKELHHEIIAFAPLEPIPLRFTLRPIATIAIKDKAIAYFN